MLDLNRNIRADRLLRLNLIGFIAVVIGFIGFSPVVVAESIGFWNRPCQKAFTDWKKRTGHKAFAISGGATIQGGQGCGWIYNSSTKDAAEKAALTACKKSQYGSGCRIISSQ
jgi:hypothetical protein